LWKRAGQSHIKADPAELMSGGCKSTADGAKRSREFDIKSISGELFAFAKAIWIELKEQPSTS
jgi:hypothetical protein